MLYIFGGLPGTGKTTLSQRFARVRRAVHLRIDIIEQALRDSGYSVNGPEGYTVAYNLAEHNLRLGMQVIADSVNPLQITRAAWRDVALRSAVSFVEIEVICSDPVEHRNRVESRSTDIDGLDMPTWDQVVNRKYEPWDTEHIVIDTAGQTEEESEAALYHALAHHNHSL